MLDTFDCPDPSTTTPKRGVTTTPLHTLVFWNNLVHAANVRSLRRALLAREAGETEWIAKFSSPTNWHLRARQSWVEVERAYLFVRRSMDSHHSAESLFNAQ